MVSPWRATVTAAAPSWPLLTTSLPAVLPTTNSFWRSLVAWAMFPAVSLTLSATLPAAPLTLSATLLKAPWIPPASCSSIARATLGGTMAASAPMVTLSGAGTKVRPELRSLNRPPVAS